MSIEQIIASISGKSEAEREKMEANARRLLERGNAVQQVEARRLLDELFAYKAAEQKARKAMLSSLPLTSRVVLAFRKQQPTIIEGAAIRALLKAPRSTAAQLSALCAWDRLAWQKHFSDMVFARRIDLWPADPHGRQAAAFYVGIVAEVDPREETFTMRPEAVLAFNELGISP